MINSKKKCDKNNNNTFFRMSFILIYILLLFTFVNIASAMTYYVRIDGNNTCSGLLNVSNSINSTDCAWRTITYSLASVNSGDIVRVQAGIYNEQNVELKRSGNVTHPIRIIGEGAILDGENIRTNGFYWYNIGGSKTDFIIDGFVIRNYTTAGIYYYVYGSGPKNITFSNNIIYNTQMGIYLNPISIPENFTIFNNTMYNINSTSTNGAIYFPNSKDAIVKNNTLYSIKNNGINWGGTNVLIEGNNLMDIGYYAITLNFGKGLNSIVTGNRISNATTMGIRADYDNINISILNNKLYRTGIKIYSNNSLFNISYNVLNSSSLVYEGGNDTIIQNNILLNQSYAEIYGTSTIYSAINTIFENNSFLNSKYLALGRMTQNVTVRNNIFNNMSGTIGAIYQTHVGGTSNDTIINNNVFNNIMSDAIDISTVSIHNITIKNNIFMNVNGFGIDNNTGTNVIAKYNLFYNNGSRNLDGLNSGGNDLFFNPLFELNDFHLRSAYGRRDGATMVNDIETSPAIGAGDPASDNSRSPWGGRIEMGAYGNTPYASRAASTGAGKLSGKSIYVNQTAVPAANVTLYYNNGTSYGQTILSGSDGSFEFKNVSAGSYYVIINKQLFEKNQTSVFISANMTTNIGSRSLVFLDVNGDKKIDVLDLSKIYENWDDDGKIYDPVSDVNGDSHVNILDASQVAKNI